MIEPERKISHRPDRNRIVDHNSAFLDGAHAKDCHLRLIDDWQPELGAEVAGVRDREGPALHVFGLQPLGTRAVGEVGNRAAQAQQVLFVCVLQHGHDEPPVEGHRNPDVDVLLVDDVVTVDGRIDDGHSPERIHHRFGDERHVGELRTCASYSAFFSSRSCATREKFTSNTECT